MHTNNLVVNHRRTGQAVKGVAKLLPHFDRKTTTAFVVESVNAVDAGAFMVAAQQEKVFRIFDFVGKEQANNLERLLAPIHVVSQKKVICLATTDSRKLLA